MYTHFSGSGEVLVWRRRGRRGRRSRRSIYIHRQYSADNCVLSSQHGPVTLNSPLCTVTGIRCLNSIACVGPTLTIIDDSETHLSRLLLFLRLHSTSFSLRLVTQGVMTYSKGPSLKQILSVLIN